MSKITNYPFTNPFYLIIMFVLYQVGGRILLFLAAALPAALSLAPCFIILKHGSIDQLACYFSKALLIANMLNSLAWLYYNLLVMKTEMDLGSVLSNGLITFSNFITLMHVCASQKKKRSVCLCVITFYYFTIPKCP